MLLPPDLREWVPEDDLVHFVIGAVDRLSPESFRVNHRGTGDQQFPPHMMLALLIHGYANGLFSSRKSERATHRDVAIRHLTAGAHPGHDTICKFRHENLEAFRESFADVLELASELKLLKLGNVSLDGTDQKADASIDQGVSCLRGKKNVSGEWTLVCLAYSLKRLHRIVEGARNGARRPRSPSMGATCLPVLLVGRWIGRIMHAASRWLHRLAAEATAKLVLTPKAS